MQTAGTGCLVVLLVVAVLVIFGKNKEAIDPHPPLSVAQNVKWYAGGSLHRANVGEWRSASRSNRLATAADWALTGSAIKNKVMKSDSIETLRPFANDLVTCVDEAASPSGYDDVGASELAAACVVLLGW